jgi:hypothetical protein
VIDAEACAGVLRRAFPRVDVRVEEGRFGARARADVPELAFLQYLYLAPSSEGRVELLLYPADTLTQARAFWAEPELARSALALRERGWRVEPNFHFGFAERGLAWVESRVSVEAYVAYWSKRGADLPTLRREEWPGFFDELIANGIASEADRLQFDQDFTATGRQTATPRPGLRIGYGWPSTRFEFADFAEHVRGRAAEALAALSA